jgi:hypothetical protein
MGLSVLQWDLTHLTLAAITMCSKSIDVNELGSGRRFSYSRKLSYRFD